jgi:hypothetical protein
MTPAAHQANQRALLRQHLLAALAAASPVSVPLATLEQQTRIAGFRLPDGTVEAELAYLVGKGLAQEDRHGLSAALVRWRITAAGTDMAEAEGLI